MYINTRNRGAVTNMVDDAFMELPCVVDLNDVYPLHFGEMPRPLAGWCQHILDEHELAVAVAVCTVAAEDLEAVRKKAEAGDATAQFSLGERFEKNLGPCAAVKWYRKAAEQGDAKAQFNLGVMYKKGRGVPEDDAEAAKWYRKAAEQGHAIAQNSLGRIYDYGDGVPENYAEAVKWYRKAAEQGLARAQYNLGVRYAKGRGVPEDAAEAVKWYRKAAEQGISMAQYNLGVMYANGEGVPEDDVAAYAWYSVAAASGDEDGRKNRDSIKDDLTPSQLEKGQTMAREIYERIKKWKAKRKAARE